MSNFPKDAPPISNRTDGSGSVVPEPVSSGISAPSSSSTGGMPSSPEPPEVYEAGGSAGTQAKPLKPSQTKRMARDARPGRADTDERRSIDTNLSNPRTSI